MFFRQKRSGKYRYLQIVENRWEDGRSKQRVIVTLGRLDDPSFEDIVLGVRERSSPTTSLFPGIRS